MVEEGGGSFRIKVGSINILLAHMIDFICHLAGKKSLYIRLGCRGDWPNIEPPGWDPSSESDVTLGTQ